MNKEVGLGFYLLLMLCSSGCVLFSGYHFFDEDVYVVVFLGLGNVLFLVASEWYHWLKQQEDDG